MVVAMLLGGCLTDAATRLAYDIEAGAGRNLLFPRGQPAIRRR